MLYSLSWCLCKTALDDWGSRVLCDSYQEFNELLLLFYRLKFIPAELRWLVAVPLTSKGAGLVLNGVLSSFLSVAEGLLNPSMASKIVLVTLLPPKNRKKESKKSYLIIFRMINIHLSSYSNCESHREGTSGAAWLEMRS